MKKTIKFILFFISYLSFSQVPEFISFRAIAMKQ